MGEEQHKQSEEVVSVPTTPAEGQAKAIVTTQQKDVSNEKAADPETDKTTYKSPADRDTVLAMVESEKRNALINAWEENEKARVQNKAHRNIAATVSWESAKKASIEAQTKKYEEKVERKKAQYAEKMKNKTAEIHKKVLEKRALIEAKKGEDSLKVEETAARFRATGYTPKKFLGFFRR